MNSWGEEWDADGYFKLDMSILWGTWTGNVVARRDIGSRSTWGPNPGDSENTGHCE